MTTAESSDDLRRLEEDFQAVLEDWPPPMFVQRQLSTSAVPRDERPVLFRRLFPTARISDELLAMWSMTDGQACSGRDDIACLNRAFHGELGQRLNELAGRASDVAAAMSAYGEHARQTAIEIQIAILTEQCAWQFASQPIAVYRPDHEILKRAHELIPANQAYWRANRRWLAWQRCASSLARLRYFAGDQDESLCHEFDVALALAQICSREGVVVDPRFIHRVDELIHQAGLIKGFHNDPSYLNLSAFVKLPERIKPPPGTVRLTLEHGKLIGNVSLPLEMSLGPALAEQMKTRAFVDFLGLEDRAVLTVMANRGRLVRMLRYDELQRAGRLDLLMRPNYFDVSLQKTDQPVRESRPSNARSNADEIFLVGPEPINADEMGGSSVITRKRWHLSFPVEHVGYRDDGNAYHEERHVGMTGMHWERALGGLLESIVTQADNAALDHIVLAPDGPLMLLPMHLATFADGSLLCDRYAISYTPGLSHFGPAPNDAATAQVVVLMNSANRLEGPFWEAEQMRRRFGKGRIAVLDGFTGDLDELRLALSDADIVHVASHGHAFADSPEASGLELAPGNFLTLRQIERLELKPSCLVFLNACSSNKIRIRARTQFSSVARAFLGAGAATVVATFWEAKDIAAALLSDRFYGEYCEGNEGRLSALRSAVDWLRTVSADELSKMELGDLDLYIPFGDRPFAHPDFWAPFALLGRW